MTRARRIEAVISRWFEPLDWVTIDGGSARLIAAVQVFDEMHYRGVEETFSIAELAEAIDAEFDRIFADELAKSVREETSRLQSDLDDALDDADHTRRIAKETT